MPRKCSPSAILLRITVKLLLIIGNYREGVLMKDYMGHYLNGNVKHQSKENLYRSFSVLTIGFQAIIEGGRVVAHPPPFWQGD